MIFWSSNQFERDIDNLVGQGFYFLLGPFGARRLLDGHFEVVERNIL